MTSLNDWLAIVKGSHLFIRQDKQMVMALFYFTESIVCFITGKKQAIPLFFFELYQFNYLLAKYSSCIFFTSSKST